MTCRPASTWLSIFFCLNVFLSRVQCTSTGAVTAIYYLRSAVLCVDRRVSIESFLPSPKGCVRLRPWVARFRHACPSNDVRVYLLNFPAHPQM